MAWTCSAMTNDGLIDNLVREDIIKKGSRVEGVFRLVDRRIFLPSGVPASYAYEDSPQTIPCEATISAPHMHAMALELLEPYLQPGNRALDVGAGSGYLVACMSLLVGSKGKVCAIEHASELTQFANKNLSAFYKQASMRRNSVTADMIEVKVVTKDGRLGDEENAPFDAIHVGAAAPEVPPALVQQLKKGGAMVIPIGPPHGSQRLDVITKDENDVVSQNTVCGVRYVPLCDLNQQLKS